MLNWIKNLGGKQPWQNKVGLDDDSLSSLEDDFGVLEKFDSELPVAVLRYLLDDEDDSIFTRLTATSDAGVALGLLLSYTKPRSYDPTARAKFFEHVRCADPGFFIRLGKIYAAAANAKVAAMPGFQGVSTVPSTSAFADPNLTWLYLLLIQGTGLSINTYPRKCRPCAAFSAELLEAMLQLEGFGPEVLIRAAFQPDLSRFNSPPLEKVFTTLKGMPECAVRHKETLVQILGHPDFQQRVYALEMIRDCKVPLAAFAGKILDLCLESSKQVREKARFVLADIRDGLRPLIEERIRSGETEQRVNAVQLLWHWEHEKARPFLEEHLKEEKNKKVAQAIKDLITPPSLEISSSAADDLLQLPPLTPIPENLPLGPDTEAAWRECFKMVNDAVSHLSTKSTPYLAAKNLQPVPADAIANGFAALAAGQPSRILGALTILAHHKEIVEPLKTFWQRPELQPIHLVRFLIEAGALNPDGEHDRRIFTYGFWLEALLPAYRRTHPETGLRELAAAFSAAKLDPARISRGILGHSFGRSLTFGMAKAQIWPFWMEHLEWLENAFNPAANDGDFMARYYFKEGRAKAFEMLAAFPAPPPRLLPMLWDLAVGPKTERPQAQRCLEPVPDKLERLIVFLGAGSAETRYAAAEWLGRLGNKAAIDPLLAAVKREKNETAKGGMMLALEFLGVPVDQFIDRAGLLKDSQKGLAKELPEDLKWFPFASLPVVHWQDTGEVVAPEIVRWWVVQGFKLKTPEPSPLLRRYCASIKQSEREALGQFILEAWIAEDTSPISRAEAEKRAHDHAQSMHHYAQYMQQNAGKLAPGQPPPPPPPSIDQYFAQALPQMLKTPKGSAIASKGVLSVAGAGLGAGAAPVVNRYLKEWYGQRAAQCKALLQMLAWVEHRTATQLMLAVGSRFRTKSIQEEANNQAQALAERKGWTIAELADRTIPSAGLDENGVFTLDYGPRQFTAKLNEDLEFTLSDPEGKAIKNLPDPRKDDDEAKATETKKNYSAAKKELKSVVTMQRERLYESMCTQRSWPFEDWNLYLNQHPIVRHLCQRLVWAVVKDNKAVRLFRPLADGSLTDAADNPVELKTDDQIRVAHECQVTGEESKTWREHLKDYDVETLFEQFGRPNFDLKEAHKNETDLEDFQGHLLEAFKLRGRATKLGYSRGQAQDGGWFFDYHKRFPTLGIEAVIEFSGNGLPEENRTVALTLMHFDRVAESESGNQKEKMLLSEVPAVLLSECWNDLRIIAAEGPGFDPDWEKKASP